MEPFNWECKFCNRKVTITAERYSNNFHGFDHENCEGELALQTKVIVCPNPECRAYDISCSLHKGVREGYRIVATTKIMRNWQLIPDSKAKTFPSYVPKVILDDYREACLIVNLSPKASATLSRRCLQGMIRDFWKISKGRLVDEIKELEEKVEVQTWQAIDSVRAVGNIGAHMEKDINQIIDVDPNEAELLIELIETLIQDWYIAKYEREDRLKKIAELARSKEALKKES